MLQRIGFFLLVLSLATIGWGPSVCAGKSLHGRSILVSLQESESPLQTQISRLFVALNHRDLETIRSQISPSRIFVQISDRTGAYLTNTQTLAVLEAFLHTHTSLSAKFEFDNSDGENGSASGTLTANRDGRTLSYKLNFGFTRNTHGSWLLTRISMR